MITDSVFGRIEKRKKRKKRKNFVEENRILNCLVERKCGRKENKNL